MPVALASCQQCNSWSYAAQIRLRDTCISSRNDVKSRRSRLENTNSPTYQFNYFPSLNQFSTVVLCSFFPSYALDYLISLFSISSFLPATYLISYLFQSHLLHFFFSLFLTFPSYFVIPFPPSFLSLYSFPVLYNV